MKLYLSLSTLNVFGVLDFAKSYLRDIEQFIESQIKKNEDLSRTLNPFEQVQKNIFDEEFDKDAEVYYKIELIKNYPNLFRSSLFVSLFSYLESILMKECKQNQFLLQDEFPNKGSTLDKIKGYLSENLHSNYNFSTSREWNEIKKYQLVRHCLAHADGNLKLLKDDKEIKNLSKFIAENNEIITLVENDESVEIFIKEGFCESFIELIGTFLVDLIDVGRGG
ncbi:MAG: hypothetical protein Q8L87_19765 [Anaerolineales bacterium]|jgi:hypothetical protein|nr:hypothetical protein [Anaerolineales bacterium]